MTGFDDAGTLAERFRQHARSCSSPLYAALMDAMADDWDVDGPVREVCAGWEDALPGSVVQLRLLAGLHRLVLLGEAPELGTFVRTVGGLGAPAAAWPMARAVIESHVDVLRAGLSLTPQTNEVGRAPALVVGLVDAVSRSGLHEVRLLEVGASAGLNLLVDYYRIDGDGWSWGPAESALRLDSAVKGSVAAQQVAVVSRRGCDLSPVDASTSEGRLLLSSYVWPDHLERFERLRAALRVAAQHPVVVEVGSAWEWVERVLAEPAVHGVLTVVWHSISRMYWPAAEVARVDAALAEAGRRMALAHVQMEYSHGAELGARLEVRVWRNGEPDGRRTDIGGVADHGVPVRLHDHVHVGTRGHSTSR